MGKTKYKPLNKSKIEIITVEDDFVIDEIPSFTQTSERPSVQSSLQSHNKQQKRRSDYIKGIILIILVNVLWIIGSEIVQNVFYTRYTLEDPYILTYITYSIFVFYLTKSFLFFLWNVITCKVSYKIPEIDYNYCTVVVALCFFWFLSGYLYSYSFQTISVASNTVLSNSTSLFTLFFSTCILGELLTKRKMLSVLLSILGIVFIAISDNDNNEKFEINIGDLWCLLSSFFYAIYSVLLTKYISSDEPITILYGRMSCLVIIIFGLPRFIMFGFDMSFQDIPLSLLVFIILKALVTNFISDILYAKSVLLTSPTVASLGLTLSIPLAFLLDFIFNKPNPTLIAIIGAVLMIIGFVLMNLSSYSQQ